MRKLVVAGGGIGGLATALAAHRAHWQVRVLEQAATFSEVGAGLQLGPNATRRLREWGLLEAARDLGCAPERLVARDALHGHALAALPLGRQVEGRYGAPYLTMHRPDLHHLLAQPPQGTGVALESGVRVDPGLGSLRDEAGAADALVGADGLWSAVRDSLWSDGPPQSSDHVAYRGLIALPGVDGPWTREITAWLGPRLHAVTYPVLGGRALNLVCVVQQVLPADAAPVRGWDLPDTRERLEIATSAIRAAGGPLLELLQAVPSWGLWVLHDRPPVSGPHQLAKGRVALVGDAAHPMRPYLAQGAAMALEDADQIGRSLRAVSERGVTVPQALDHYAQVRWARVARVQRRAARNGRIFHAQGLTRLARDLALRGLGGPLMDLPWLYKG